MPLLRSCLTASALAALAFALAPAAGAQPFRADAGAANAVPDSYSGAFAWADYDGDGRLDLAHTGGSYAGDVGRIFRNDGSGGLTENAAASAVLPDVSGSALAWGDADGDGDPDLAVTGQTQTAGYVGLLLRNDGAAGFSVHAAASAAIPDVRFGALAWADLDGDGDLDLAVTGQGAGGSVGVVLMNDGTGALAVHAASSAAVPDVRFGMIAWGDYDSDGDLDVVLAGQEIAGTIVGTVIRNNRITTNTTPTVSAGPDRAFVVGARRRIDGIARDADNDPLVIAWTIAGPGAPVLSGATRATPEFCAAQPGTFTVTLTVDDGEALVTDAAVLTAYTPVAAFDRLMSDVEALRAAGALTAGQARPLTRSLSQGQANLSRGRTSRALTSLDDFERQMLALQTGGVLTEVQARPLMEVASAIRLALTTPCTGAPAVAAAELSVAAGEAALLAVGPNPTTGPATVRFALAAAADVRLAVYDALGREVAVLADAALAEGPHAVTFDGRGLAPGVYVVRLVAGERAETRRLTLVR